MFMSLLKQINKSLNKLCKQPINKSRHWQKLTNYMLTVLNNAIVATAQPTKYYM